jgi:hypothetical protein
MEPPMFDRIKRLPFEKILAVASVFVLLFVVALATYDKAGKSDVNVRIRLESSQDPFVTLPHIVPDSIRNVRQIDKDRNEYVVTISTRRNRKDLLDSILRIRGVEDATIHIVKP